MTIETEIQALTQATTDLLNAVNVSKATLDGKVTDADSYAQASQTSANNAAASAATATTKADQAAGSAASAMAIYGNTAAQQAAVTAAQNAASVAAGHAASAASVVQQDLSGVSAAALHRSPNAVTAMFVYDTSKDSDGGAWTEKCQHTSWYNEPLNGKWLGAQASEAAARAVAGATTGDYFQRTTDGKFYKLNDTSGTTEVFRGSKAKFPRLSAIVAEAGNLTIYDLTEPDRPMWARYIPSSTGGPAINGLAALQGQIWFSGNAGLIALRNLNFASDKASYFSNTPGRLWEKTLKFSEHIYNGTAPTNPVAIGSAVVNAVAMTVLPDAPVDPATGLQVPTIAVATGSGVSVIKHNGTVVKNNYAGVFIGVQINKNLLTACIQNAGHLYYAYNPGSLQDNFTLAADTSTSAPDFNIGNATPNGLLNSTRSEFLRRSSAAATVQKLKNFESDPAKSAAATITNTFNTGHMTGDIRRAYLADVDVGSVSNPSTVADRSYKAASATVNGTLTKSAVASAAQLVAYSGFSAANYLQEPYSADLDFGTGEWSAGAWVNVPVTLPEANFPVTGAELVTNGTFDVDTTGWTARNGTISATSGVLRIAQTTTDYALAYQAITCVIGAWYKLTVTVVTPATGGAGFVQLGVGTSFTSGDATFNRSVNAAGTYDLYFAATATTMYVRPMVNVSNDNVYAEFDNISVMEVRPALIADRAHSSGAKLHIGLSHLGYLIATAFDGTTTRTVTTTAAYNTASWLKAEACYTTDGTLSIRVNGQQVAATYGAPLLTLNNPDAVLTIGNSYALDAPFPGSLALLKLSATVPTAEQSQWMYEQEKQLFRDGAQCCLPDSGAIVDLTYDDATDKWIAVSATNQSEWSGLVRTSVKAVPAGSFSKVAATSGVKLEARTTTSPGVDITIPAYGLREELVKRAEFAARLARNLTTFDYVGGFTANTTNGSTSITNVAGLSYPTSHIGAQVTGAGIPAGTVITAVSGTTVYLSKAATTTATAVQISFTDFILPVGYEAKAVMSAGALKQEGATKDYTRLFDGFKEAIRFGTAPGYLAAVQIQATRSAA